MTAWELPRSLEESEARLRLAVEAGAIGIWEWRLDSGEMIYSPEAKAICGFPLDQPVTREMVVAVTHSDDFPRTSAQAGRALDPAIRDASPYEYRIVRAGGEVRWVAASGRVVFEERGGETVAVRYLGTLIDITERREAESKARLSEQRLELALKAGRMAIWEADAHNRLIRSPTLNALVGLPAEATPTIEDLAPNFPPGELEHFAAVAEAARAAGERYFEVEYRYRMPDGETHWFGARVQVRIDDDGEVLGTLGVIVDITDQKAAQERLELLNREIDHRANNLMGVIQGAVAMSEGSTAGALKQTILGRLHALARAHQLLSDTRWTGADLRLLIAEELLAYSLDDGHRVVIEGPAVALRPAAAQAMAMALHELATNAAKHGALSRRGGRVEVTWSVEAGRLCLRWRESGGPPVAPPARQGFGMLLLGRVLGGELHGQVRLEWQAGGLSCELELALHKPEAADA